MTRSERLDWCKKRAYQEIARGKVAGAFASFLSDTKSYDEVADVHAFAKEFGNMLLMAGALSTPGEMRAHIEGYN